MTESIEQAVRAKYEAEAARKQEAFAAQERALKAEKAQLERTKLDLETVVAEKVAAEKAVILTQGKAVAKREGTTEIKLVQVLGGALVLCHSRDLRDDHRFLGSGKAG